MDEPYTPPPGHEDDFLTFGSDSLRVPLDHLCHFSRRPVSMYPSYLGCEREAAVEMNRFAATAGLNQKKKRAQFVCVAMKPDRMGRETIRFEYVGDLPPGLRVKPNLFESWFPNILSLRDLPGHVQRVALPDPRLASVIVDSSEDFRVNRDAFAKYVFDYQTIHGTTYLSVTRSIHPTKNKDQLQPARLSDSKPKPIKPRATRRSKSLYTRGLPDLTYIGASCEIQGLPKHKTSTVSRCVRQWAARYNPDARYSVRWDKHTSVVRVTRVAAKVKDRRSSSWPYLA